MAVMRFRPVPQRGFTWIEMLMVIAVISILALMAIPSLQETAVKKQVKEGMEIADIAKKAVQAHYASTGEWPPNNAAAGAPPRNKIISALVTEVDIKDGAVTLTYGNNATKAIEGMKLTILPAIVPGQRGVPIAWLCHENRVPKGMELQGKDLTDIPDKFLPLDCRLTQ
jgi:type IV pilus assembly protein PilA